MYYVIITILGAVAAWIYSLLRRIDTLQDESSKNKYDSEFKDLNTLLDKAKIKVEESERDYSKSLEDYKNKKNDK